MDQRVSMITLGVADLSRARRFYNALGWHGQESQQTVFFQAGPMAVVLWSRSELAADSGMPVGEQADPAFDGMVLAQNVRSPGEVDHVIKQARAAGARITREPAITFYGGYAGYFADPDGHVWEVAHNPGFALEADGALTLPDLSVG